MGSLLRIQKYPRQKSLCPASAFNLMRYVLVRHIQTKSPFSDRLGVLSTAFGGIGVGKKEEFSLEVSEQILARPHPAERSLRDIDCKGCPSTGPWSQMK